MKMTTRFPLLVLAALLGVQSVLFSQAFAQTGSEFRAFTRQVDAEFVGLTTDAAEIFVRFGGTKEELLKALTLVKKDALYDRGYAFSSQVAAGAIMAAGMASILYGSITGGAKLDNRWVLRGGVSVFGGILSHSFALKAEEAAGAQFGGDQALEMKVAQAIRGDAKLLGLDAREEHLARQLLVDELKKQERDGVTAPRILTSLEVTGILSEGGVISVERARGVNLILAAVESERGKHEWSEPRGTAFADAIARLRYYRKSLRALIACFESYETSQTSVEAWTELHTKSRDRKLTEGLLPLLEKARRLESRIQFALESKGDRE